MLNKLFGGLFGSDKAPRERKARPGRPGAAPDLLPPDKDGRAGQRADSRGANGAAPTDKPADNGAGKGDGVIIDIDALRGLKPTTNKLITDHIARLKKDPPAFVTQDFGFYQIAKFELERQEITELAALLALVTRVARGRPVTVRNVSRAVFETLLNEHKKASGPAAREAQENQQQVSGMLLRAIQNKATDIHIEIKRGRCKVYERVFGILHQREHFGAEQGKKIINAVWNMHVRQNFSEADVAKDGRFEHLHAGKRWLCRVSYAMSKVNQESSMAIRLRDMNDIPPLEQLGYSERQLWLIRRAMATKGMILMIGSVNSGKSTTQTAIMQERPYNKKNFELSDQIEVQLDNFVQIQMPTEGKEEMIRENRERLMRVSTRHDVNFIAINEIRDQLTAAMASAMLLQGTAAISSIHGSSWADALNRMISPTDLAISPDILFSESFLSLLVTQMLLSVLCKSCRLSKHPDREQQAYFTRIFGNQAMDNVRWRDVDGCDACGGSGIEALTLAAEVIPVNEINRHLLKDTTNARAMREWQQENNVDTIHQHAYSKIMQGTIDPLMAEEKLGPFSEFNLFDAYKSSIESISASHLTTYEGLGTKAADGN